MRLLFKKNAEQYQKPVPWIGLTGAGIIFLGMAVSGVFYRGRRGEPFSLLNHFVSELGETEVSKLAWAFNGGLVIGGLLLMVFLLLFSLRFSGWFRYLFALMGLVTGLSGALVGVFPMNVLGPHIRVAMTFFYAGMVMMLVVSIYLLAARQSALPRWLALPGLVNGAIFILFLFFPTGGGQDFGSGEESLGSATEKLLWNRPEVLTMAVLEWFVILGVLAWVVILCVYLLRQNDHLEERSD